MADPTTLSTDVSISTTLKHLWIKQNIAESIVFITTNSALYSGRFITINNSLFIVSIYWTLIYRRRNGTALHGGHFTSTSNSLFVVYLLWTLIHRQNNGGKRGHKKKSAIWILNCSIVCFRRSSLCHWFSHLHRSVCQSSLSLVPWKTSLLATSVSSSSSHHCAVSIIHCEV